MLFYGTPLLYFELYDIWPHQVGVTCISSQTISSENSDMVLELSLGESHDSVDDSAAEDYSDLEEDYHSNAEKHVSVTIENYDLVFGNFQHSGNSILDAMPLEPAIPIKPKSDGLTIKIGEITCFLVVDTANGKSNDSATKQEEKEMETEIDVAEDDQYEHETTKEFIHNQNSSTATADLAFEITEKSKKVITNLLEKVDQVDPKPIDLVPRHQHHQVPLFSVFPLSPTTTSSTSSPLFAFGIEKCRFVATMAEFLCYNIYIFDPGRFSILRLRAVTFEVLDDERRCGSNHHGLHLHVESCTVPLLIPPLRILKLIIDLRIATPLENLESETCHCRSCVPEMLLQCLSAFADLLLGD